MRTTHVVVVAALFACAAAPAAAQSISGRVLDAASRRPIPEAALRLLAGDSVIAQAVSDTAGRFVLRAPSAGRYHIAAARIGYADTRSAALTLSDNQSLAADLELSVEAVKIAPLTVEAARDPYLENVGFYERQRTGAGAYLDEAELRRRPAHNFVELMRSVRGVRTQRVNARYEIYLSSPTCLPQVVLDGVMVRWGGRTVGTIQPLEDIVKPAHVEAIEVYRAFSGVPTQYVGPNAQCGTILIWTRHR